MSEETKNTSQEVEYPENGGKIEEKAIFGPNKGIVGLVSKLNQVDFRDLTLFRGILQEVEKAFDEQFWTTIDQMHRNRREWNKTMNDMIVAVEMEITNQESRFEKEVK